MVDGMKTVAMYQRHLPISTAPPLWLNVKKASQTNCNSAKVLINYAFWNLLSDLFQSVHPILGTLIDLIIIPLVDLTKTSFLALVIDYVLVFSRRLLSKKIWYILTIRFFLRNNLNCWRCKEAQKWYLNSCPSKNPYS